MDRYFKISENNSNSQPKSWPALLLFLHYLHHFLLIPILSQTGMPGEHFLATIIAACCTIIMICQHYALAPGMD